MSRTSFARGARRRVFAAAALTLGAAACSGESPVDPSSGIQPSLDAAPVTMERSSNGLQQRVTITPARPATGDTINVRSVLVNRGSAPVRVEHVVCGLDYERTTVLADPFVHCAAYSITSTLAVGDSIVQNDWRVVAARPGSYTVRVRQVVPPSSLAVDLPITVRQP